MFGGVTRFLSSTALLYRFDVGLVSVWAVFVIEVLAHPVGGLFALISSDQVRLALDGQIHFVPRCHFGIVACFLGPISQVNILFLTCQG